MGTLGFTLLFQQEPKKKKKEVHLVILLQLSWKNFLLSDNDGTRGDHAWTEISLQPPVLVFFVTSDLAALQYIRQYGVKDLIEVSAWMMGCMCKPLSFV